MNYHVTSIIDRPLSSKEDDQLNIRDYQTSLCNFIRHSETPITIAIRGQWGSGKTSFMNGIQEELCKNTDSPYYSVWINAWHYSLMKDPTEALMKVISAIINDVGEKINDEYKGAFNDKVKKVKDVSTKLFKGITRIAITAAASHIGPGDVNPLVDSLLSEESSSTIDDLRKELSNLINDCIMRSREMESPKRGFLIFIDDLDRIDPPAAVNMLELFKNIFDLQHCIFILAIDYDVVVKGLKPKFGELTEKNEREFRSFFDKIIQLPFQMPVQTYVIDKFVQDSLSKIGFIAADEFKKDDTFSDIIMEFVRNSVGSNPRGLKRLFNILSLINLINESKSGDFNKDEKLVTFGLVCLQISYSYIYDLLADKSNFVRWDEPFAQKKEAPQNRIRASGRAQRI